LLQQLVNCLILVEYLGKLLHVQSNSVAKLSYEECNTRFLLDKLVLLANDHTTLSNCLNPINLYIEGVSQN